MKLVIKNGTIAQAGYVHDSGSGHAHDSGAGRAGDHAAERGNNHVHTVPNGQADIFIDNGIIAAIEEKIDLKSLGQAVDIIDASGLTVLPGLIDAHCHLRDPGYEYKEDIETGTASAALGGFTAVACMPNTDPTADNAQIIKYIIDKAETSGHVAVYPIGAITKGLLGEELAEIGEIKFAGAVAISDDGNSVASPSMMKKALLYSKVFDIPVISHCEDTDLADGGDMNEGYVSMELGLRGIPSISESVQVARDILISEYTGVPIHIAHVSTEASVEIIRNAKRRGVNVTCETCPHYFTLTDEACYGYDTNAKVAPPLALASDVEAVKAGIADGTIDIIATDHAPHHIDEKNVEFALAARGLVGFETAFGLAYTQLVLPGIITIGQLVEKMSLNPARLLKIDDTGSGSIAVGRAANLTIVDLERKYIVAPENFASKSKNSPFGGMELTGAIMYVIAKGKAIVRQSILID